MNPESKIENRESPNPIRTIRGAKVILDTDLAQIYGVPVKRLNEQVRRNPDRFPADFAFQLTAQETRALRVKSSADSAQKTPGKEVAANWSQIATSSRKHRGVTYRPYAFTEHGAIMAASVLNSPRAVEMSVFVVRAFGKMREQLQATATLARRLAEVERALLTHDAALRDLYQKLRPLLLPPEDPPRKPIGFSVKEGPARYAARRRSPPARPAPPSPTGKSRIANRKSRIKHA